MYRPSSLPRFSSSLSKSLSSLSVSSSIPLFSFPKREIDAWKPVQSRWMSDYQDFLKKANSLRTEGRSLINQKKYADAELPLLTSLALYRKANNQSGVGRTSFALGYSLHYGGRFVEAEKFYKEGLQLMRSNLAPSERVEIGFALNNLAELYSIQKRMGEAEECTREAVKILEKLAPQDSFYAFALSNFSGYLVALNKLEEAETYCQKAVEILKNTLGCSNRLTLTCLNNLASIHHKLGHKDKLKALQDSWNKTVVEERKQIVDEAHKFMESNAEHLKLLEREWRSTVPQMCTPPGFFLPPKFVENLYKEVVLKKVVPPAPTPKDTKNAQPIPPKQIQQAQLAQ